MKGSKWLKRIAGITLAAAMTVMQLPASDYGMLTTYAEEVGSTDAVGTETTDVVVEEATGASAITDGGFENGTESWTYTLLDGADTGWTKAPSTDAKYEGIQSFNFWLGESTGAFTMTQKLSLTAGTYTLSAQVQDADGATVEMLFDGTAGDAVVTDNGWGNWSLASGTFTLDADAEVEVGFRITGTAIGAWGYIDAVTLKREVEVEPADSELYVGRIENIDEDFIRGVDISTYISEVESGVRYKDFDGNVLQKADGSADDQAFFNLLADSGVNYVRIRVWNKPRLFRLFERG